MPSHVFALAMTLILSCLLPATPGLALDLMRFYRGSCQSESGFIIDVNKKDVTILSLKGETLAIQRSDLVGIAVYSIPMVPFNPAIARVSSKWYAFSTFRHGQKMLLGKGWLIGFSKERIALLNHHLEEQTINRDDIWEVSEVPVELSAKDKVQATGPLRYLLRDPLSFESCPAQMLTGKGIEAVDRSAPLQGNIIPSASYEDPIAIKRYIDSYQAYYEQVHGYLEHQSFYAVPQKYKNRTFIGTWGILGSRYANVGARQTNFLPLVEDQFSEGPFGFQRVMRSGVSPLRWGVHEEPFVQVFYGLKADYIHLDVFLDPTFVMIGKQYEWKKDQLNKVDDRYIEMAGAEFGFDVGAFSLAFAASNVAAGVRVDDLFLNPETMLGRLGLSFQGNDYKLTAYYGTTEFDQSLDHTGTEVKYPFHLRFTKLLVDFAMPFAPQVKASAQFIERRLQDSGFSPGGQGGYEGTSHTGALRIDWPVNYRWVIYGLGSLEKQKAHGHDIGQEDKSADQLYVKVAGGVSYDF